MSLVNYSSSSSSNDSSDEDADDKPKCRLGKLPVTKLPNAADLLGIQKTAAADEPYDDPSKHAGRLRSFKHERGIWASFVFIPVIDNLLETAQCCCQTAMADVVQLELSANLHLSLSKTVILQHHLIDSFFKSLQTVMDSTFSFSVSMHRLKIYTNAEKTRTFVAYELDKVYCDKMMELMRRVDTVMVDFNLPTFYEPPSFHVSFLWCLGNKVNVLHERLDTLMAVMEPARLDVREVRCKAGNKEFAIALRKPDRL